MCHFGQRRVEAGTWDFEGKAGNKHILAWPPGNSGTQKENSTNRLC